MRRSSLFLGLLLAACGSTEPHALPTLEFHSQILFGIPTLPPTAVSSDGIITISGVIHTEGTGFTLTGKISLTGSNSLSLEIDVEDNLPGLPFGAQNFYQAKVGGLVPGDYDLSVIHNIRDPSPGSRLRTLHETVHVD